MIYIAEHVERIVMMHTNVDVREEKCQHCILVTGLAPFTVVFLRAPLQAPSSLLYLHIPLYR